MRLRIAVAERVCAASVRRPRSVHRPLNRERVEQRDRMHMAVTGEMTVVAVDHRDARADEARDCEHRNTSAEREGGVGVPEVVEPTDRFDTSGDLRGSPVAAAETRKSTLPPRTFGNRIGLTDAGSRSSASSAFACPLANARRT